MTNDHQLVADKLIEYLKSDMESIKNDVKEFKKELREDVEKDMSATGKKLKEIEGRLGSLEEFVKFVRWTIKWVLPLGLFLWPLILPIIQRWLLNFIPSDNMIAELIGFLYPLTLAG